MPSLGSINYALQGLLQPERQYTTQIAEIIRRDPSLTARLLRLVNSVYYGLPSQVSSIEEAVFYLGIRQIRQLVMVTPVIEDFQRLTRQCHFPWREFWQHCIATALLSPEVVNAVQSSGNESEYVAGLVHDVGKIVMAWAFPDHFTEVHRRAVQGVRPLVEIERDVLGIDHGELGALYLERHHLPEVLVKTARFHHHPEKAEGYERIVASVQIADLLVRSEKIGCSGDYCEVTREQCFSASGWDLLLAENQMVERTIAQASLSHALQLMPKMLEDLV